MKPSGFIKAGKKIVNSRLMHGQFTKEKIELGFKGNSQGQIHKHQHAGIIPYKMTSLIYRMWMHKQKTNALNPEIGENIFTLF